MTDQPTGPACGNNPNFQMSDGDRKAVAEFRAYLADRAALRDRITEALYAHDHPGHLVPLNETGMGPAYRESADAVLAVLPEQAARDAVLRAAEQIREDAALRDAEGETELAQYGRELAELITPAEAQPAKPVQCSHGCDTSICPCLACEAAEEQPATEAQLASLAVNAAKALRDEKRHYEIACEENARLRATVDRVRRLHDNLAAETDLASPDDQITRGAAARRIATALDGWNPTGAPQCDVEFEGGSRCAKPAGHRPPGSDDPHVPAPVAQQPAAEERRTTWTPGPAAVAKAAEWARQQRAATVDPAMCPRCKGDNSEAFDLCAACAAVEEPQ